MGTSDEPDVRSQEGVADTIAAEPSQPPIPVRNSTPTMPPPSPADRYQLGAELGRGGMGRVVEALDVALGRKVALKEVLPRAGGGSSRRFEREVALTARLEHPSIVPLYDAGTMPDGRPYYVMRRVSGRPLDDIITRTRTLDERLAYLPALQSAIDAIAHAHRRGVIHRDLKPANILVGELGETVVIDWGLAKVIGEEDDPASRDSIPSDSLRTQMGSVFGTPGFMAPEQARGEEIGPQGDVYALGATLYQLLAGTPPHAGKSATEVLDKTLRHAVVPLPKIAPGTPAELVTIVNKALAPEARDRYPHAGALGEDVRRFLTGQLVAAHDYTTRERFVRFAKKHRGALSVAALALAVVAVLAWLGVARIVHERDAAHEARAQAVAEKAAAEQAHRELAIRLDALLVSRARGRLDSDPTEALATLKQLPVNSTQLDEARAVAQAAVQRGVTWAMQGTLEFTTIAQLSRDAKQLLQVTRDGTLRIWDLERRRIAVQRPFAALTRAVWIAGDKLLVTHHDGPAAIFDPKGNALEILPLPAIDLAFASDDGTRVVFHGPTGAGVFDVTTRAVTTLSAAKIGDTAIAPDGSIVAWVDDKATIAATADGKVLARLPVRAARVAISSARTVAALHDNTLYELAADGAKFVEIPRHGERDDLIVDLLYRGRELVVVTGRMTLWAWNGTTTYARGKLTNIVNGLVGANGQVVVALSSDNKVHYMDPRMQGHVQLPANLRRPRLVASPHTGRVLVIADGIILGLDLDQLRPRMFQVSPDTNARFVDDDTLLVSTLRGWAWLDVSTGTQTPIRHDTFGPLAVAQTEPAGRALVTEDGPRGQRLVLLRKGSTDVQIIAEAAGAWGCLVPGNALVFTTGDARVLAIVDDGPARELVKMEGTPDGAVAIGHRRVAIHSSAGELVRIDLDSGKIDRTTVALGQSFLLAAEPSGRVVIAEDARLMLWDGVVTQLATFAKPIAGLVVLDGVLAIQLRDNETHLLELSPNSTPRRVFPASRHAPVASRDGKLLVGIGNAEQLEVVELPSRARWSVPELYRLFGPGMVVSPSKRRVLQHAHDRLLMWQLPHAPRVDFASWLDEQTNAAVDTDGELQWPWQVAAVAP